MFRIPLLLSGMCLLLLNGCQFAPSAEDFQWPWKKDDPKPVPDRVLAVWTDTILHQPNQPGVRGFGGRVYFYNSDDSEPIAVEGGLAVYVFDAESLNASQQKPLRKYVFTADQFASHMSKTSLGPSYSVWLPWDEVGGPQKKLSIIVRFEGINGGTTISEPTIKLLPGIPQKHVSSEEELASANNVTLAGHQTVVAKQTSADESNEEDDSDGTQPSDRDAIQKRRIETIDLPPSFQRHLDSQSNESGVPSTQAPTASPSSNRNSSLPNGMGSGLGNTGLSKGTSPVNSPEIDSSEIARDKSAWSTQVQDYRSRVQERRLETVEAAKRRQAQSSSATYFDPSRRRDIRQGSWIDSLERPW